MEIWDLYNSDRTKLNKTMVRGNTFEKNTYHLVVQACIFNKEGKMLIQQRQPFRSDWPNLWDISVGGSAVAGDTSQSAIEREVYEEIGLKINFRGKRPNLTVNFDEGFSDIYLLEYDVDLSNLTLQYEEVQNVKWATLEEIIQMIKDKLFIPYYEELISLFFQMRNTYGCHKLEE
jgi:isopentenyldiphosphate isomerase